MEPLIVDIITRSETTTVAFSVHLLIMTSNWLAIGPRPPPKNDEAFYTTLGIVVVLAGYAWPFTRRQ